jgi:hypothetical protein
MKCKKHPKYKAKSRPRVPCYGCWWMYLTLNHDVAKHRYEWFDWGMSG